MTDHSNSRKPLVDRTKGRRLPAPRAAQPNREDLFFPVRCGNPECNHVRWLTRSDAERAEAEQRVCRKCQASAAGRKGYAATVALYGVDFALNAVRQKQLDCPSRYEIIVDSWLKELAAPYESQIVFSATDPENVLHNFVIDFVVQLPASDIAVEVNGYHHKKLRAERDYWLAQLYPGEVHFIDTDDIDHNPKAVREFLAHLVQAQ